MVIIEKLEQMAFEDNMYIIASDLSFTGVLQDIKKSRTALQPIWEAFTNALEAIKIKQAQDESHKGAITVEIHAVETTGESYEFSKLSITDNGIGFNDEEFRRFNTFKLTTKGYKNLGSGRIQFVQYFDNTQIDSYFVHNNEYFRRKFMMSRKKAYLDKNALVFHESCSQVEKPEVIVTKVTFNTLLDDSNIYNNLNATTFKGHMMERYISYFCTNKNSLPNINIDFYLHGELKASDTLKLSDIPNSEKQEIVKIHYQEIAGDGKITESTDSEDFEILAFKISKDVLRKNELKLSSKGEIIDESGVVLEGLSENDHIKNNKFLFVISSDYIDVRDTNVRGQLDILSKDNFSKGGDAFRNKEIFIEDIQDKVNSKIATMYPEIDEVKQIHVNQLNELKEMFGLDENTAQGINISINDSESKILEKFYEAEAKKTATIDASIKQSIDKLNSMDTTDENYNEELKKEINKLVKVIPIQNKTSLTHYVARRKLVLDLFQKILDRELIVQQQGGRNFDEALIHNLMYQQHTDSSENSDLWILSEDFIYFKGTSEEQLEKLTIHGKKVFKRKFSEEEERYLKSLGENRTLKRPDILLFPEEGKCIIIEFKTPGANVSEHLTQIDSYASMIRNYTEDEFQIVQFYGYLIGESIEARDVQGRVSAYEHSYQFDYLFRPATKVVGFDGRGDGSIYNEVIKYSTLLKRAQQRNQIFLSKLMSGMPPEK